MTLDDAHTSHSHGFELPETPPVVARRGSQRWRAVAGVAICLGLVGIVTGLIVAHRQSVSDAHLTSDALQREELRDGWKALGAAAAQEAEANAAQARNAVPNAAAPPPNVVIVNVPAPSAAAAPPNVAPSNVTNITLPNGSSPAANGAPSENVNSGTAPIQSLPAINFSPVQSYPSQAGYPSPPSSETPPTGYLPQNSYGTSTPTPTPAVPTTTPNPGVAPMPPPIGNGSIPGSTPNPALPNNGLVGSAPVQP